MPKGELNIKNDMLAEIIGRVLNEKGGSPVVEGKSVQEQGEELVATYAIDMVSSGWEVGVDPDFTYGSLKDLPVATASCCRRYQKGDHPDFCVESTVKSLAAYFFALSMNEQNLSLQVRRPPMIMNPSKPPKDPLWGMFRIEAVGRKNADFLLSVSEGTKVLKVGDKHLMTIDLAALIRVYKATTGVDLTKHDLHSIAFDL